MAQAIPFNCDLVADIGEKSHLTSTLDSGVQIALVLRASARNTAGQDLGTLGDELSQFGDIFVINRVNLVHAEEANLLLSVRRTEGTRVIVRSFH